MRTVNSCGAFITSGLGDCTSRFQPIIGLLISKKGTTYTAAESQTIAKTKTNVSLAAGIVSIYIPISGLKDNTPAPNVETSQTGVQGIFSDAVPAMTVYMNRSFDDWRQFWALNSTVVEVEFITSDRKRLMTTQSNGIYKGFRGQMYAQKGLPKMENAQEAYPIDIFFSDTSEFAEMRALPMSYSGSEIEQLVPAGLNLEVVGAYVPATNKVSVKATNRGSSGVYSLLDVAEIVSSENVIAPTVVLGVGAAGVYELTLTDGANALTAGQSITVQLNKTTATYALYITSPVTIDGVTP